MIGGAIIPSLYILEIEGVAVNKIFPAEFNVSHVTIGSAEFPTDIQAAAAAEKIITLACDGQGVESMDLNPDFFSLENDIAEDFAAAADETLSPDKATIQVITNKFDELGDFVAFRKTISGDGFSVKLRVLANPSRYISELRRAKDAKFDIACEHRELSKRITLQ
jgi:hypothetical protein